MSNRVILTIDLEDWYHLFDHNDPSSWLIKEQRVYDMTNKLLDILYQYNFKATFMVLGWVAEKYPSLIREISNQGHDIGTHSHNHNLIYTQTKEQFKQDLIKSISIIEDSIGKIVNIYRAPGFSIRKDSLWAFDILAEAGIEYDLSLFPGKHRFGGLAEKYPKQPFIIKTEFGIIKEYPVTVYNIASVSFARCGGGYFRLLPYFLIKMLLRNSNYQMSYFHPRDFDYHQPRMDMPLLNYFKSYVGIRGSEKKFQKLMDDNTMVPLSYDIQNRDWRHAETLDVNQINGC